MAFAWIRRRSSRRSSPSKRCERSRRWVLAAALLLAGGPAAAIPPSFTARYEVSHSGLTLGEATVRYQQIGADRYRYSSVTRPVGITTMFYNAQIEELSEGRITSDGFKPERYEYDRTGSRAREASLVFDWQALKVRNDVEGKSWDMKIPADALDRMVSQLQLMRDLAESEQNLTYRVADGGKLRVFVLQVLGRERIDTPYGRLETVKIIRKVDTNRRSTVFWCAPALHYMPVRIDHREKGENFRMTLANLTGFKLPDSG